MPANVGLTQEYQTAVDLTGFEGKSVRTDVNGQLVANTLAATRGVGVLVGVYLRGLVQYGRVQFAGGARLKVSAPVAALAALTNDVTGNFVTAGPGQVVLAVATAASVGLTCAGELLGDGLSSNAVAAEITPYVVGPAPLPYQTIQSAIDAAFAAGGGTVYIRQGSYPENVILRDGVDLVGISDATAGAGPRVMIIGKPATALPAGHYAPGAGGVVHMAYVAFLPQTVGEAALLVDGANAGLITGYLCQFTGNQSRSIRLENTGNATMVVAFGGVESSGPLPVNAGVVHQVNTSTMASIFVEADITAPNPATDLAISMQHATGFIEVRRAQVGGKVSALNGGLLNFIDTTWTTQAQGLFEGDNNVVVLVRRSSLNQDAPAAVAMACNTGVSFVFEDVSSQSGLTFSGTFSQQTQVSEPDPDPTLFTVSSPLDAFVRFALLDTTAGAVALSLPDLTSVKPGHRFSAKWFKGLNAASLAPFGFDGIDSVPAPFVFAAIQDSVVLRADPVHGTWQICP